MPSRSQSGSVTQYKLDGIIKRGFFKVCFGFPDKLRGIFVASCFLGEKMISKTFLVCLALAVMIVSVNSRYLEEEAFLSK